MVVLTLQCYVRLSSSVVCNVCIVAKRCVLEQTLLLTAGGTAAAVPPPFRPDNPALCGSHPLVTPYHCRLGDLLCFVFIVSDYCIFLHYLQCESKKSPLQLSGIFSQTVGNF